MTATLEATYKERKEDVVNLIILIFIASAIGIYLIATTVLIADDGMYYIERAQKISTHPAEVIKSDPPGYPFLIYMTHKCTMLFSKSSSVYMWIYAAQAVSLLCRVLALVSLYFIGRLLIGSRSSFWAIIILILLPYPTAFGSDALRDWSYILFLAAGFLFLLWGIKEAKWWCFGITGLVAGLGFIIRPECVQLLVYGFLWILVRLLKPKSKMSRPKLLCAFLILLIGFTLPVAPYAAEAGRIIPPKMGEFIVSSKEYVTSLFRPQSQTQANVESDNQKSRPANMIVAIGRLSERISENLMYLFVPALLIGIYSRFRKKSGSTDLERFIMPVFIILNVIIMILLYGGYEYMSRRHCLPLVVFLMFYVVTGLQVLSNWLGTRNVHSRSEAEKNSKRWFFILLAIGMAVCLPKLLRPLRIKKQGYRVAAKWLNENTAQQDLIAVPDKRICFYAQREGVMYGRTVPEQAKYVVTIVRDESETKFSRTVKKEYSCWVDLKKKEKKLVIYRVM